MGRLSLVKVKNPFTRTDRDIEVIEYKGQSLLDLRKEHFPEDINVIISVNGKVIPEEYWDKTFPQNGDQILFIPKVEGGGGGGKDPLRAVLMIATMATAIYFGPALGAALGISEALGSFLICAAGGLLINTLLPPPKPKIDVPGLDYDKSNTYSWSPHTTQQQGLPVPKIYGKVKTYGNIISTYIENINDKQYLNILIALGTGPIKGISDIKINDQPIENFKGVELHTRYGYLNQEVVPNFNDTKVEYSTNVKISYDSPYTYTTVGNEFDGLEVDITFPKGLWYANNNGGLDPVSVELKIEYRKVGESDWQIFVQDTVTAAKQYPVRRTYRKGDLEKGQYEIRVSRLTPDRTSARYGDEMYFTAVREVYYDDFEYPRLALVGIKALASDQLSGSLRFSCIVEGALVRVWDGNQWKVEWSNNPAWIAWDILTQPVFDNDLNVIRYDGIDPSRLDLQKFKEWADFCDELVPDGKGGYEKRVTFNGIFDSETTMWEAVMQVCQVGRAVLVWNGINLTVAINKPAVPVQMFTVGNIGVDSFKEMFLPMEDRASEIEIDFLNEEKDYERDKLAVINPEIKSKTQKINLQLFGITKPSEAWRAGMYRLACNQYLTRTIEFEADIDAIACTIGDVILVQHDVPQWGYGGRIVSATTDTVVLDKKISVEADKTYAIMVRLSDDTIVERTLVTPATSGEYDTFTLATPFDADKIPQQFDIYAFGEVEKITKPFRVIEIAKSQEQKVTIKALEYNESIYNVDYQKPVLPTFNYSVLEPIPSVKNLQLKEVLIKGQDGTLFDNIDVYFDIPSETFEYAEIWYRKGSADWIYVGSSATGYFRISAVEVNQTYEVAVLSVNIVGDKQSLQEAEKASIYTLGKLAPPSDVQNFTARQNGQFIEFSWDHIPDADLWGYEIREGINWKSARIIATAISHNRYTWQPELNGTYRFWIKAMDESGIYSVNPTPVDITVKGIDEKLNIVLQQDEMTKEAPADGTKTNFVYVPQYQALMLPFTLTDTDVPDWTDQTPDIVNYTGDRELYAEYITNVIDSYKNTDTWIRIVTAIDAIDTGATDQSYPDRTDLTYPSDTDLHVTMPVDFSIWYRISDDNVNWSDWKRYLGAVQETFRYIQVKFQVDIASQTGRLKLEKFLITLDVPDVHKIIQNLNVPSTGLDLVFSDYGLDFYVTPVVKTFIKDSTTGKLPVVSNTTTDGCHIDIYDFSNNKVDGVIDVEITGY